MTQLSDAELWGRIRADDAEAFGLLFRRHGPVIHRYVLRRTADAHGAEDVAATVFLEVWRQRHHVELHQPSALPWLYGVATNLLRSRRRRALKEVALDDRLRALPAPPPELVERRIEAAEEARGLLTRVAALPRRQQDVLILTVWEGLSVAQIAVALDIPAGTVKSRLSRARARLAAPPPPDPDRRANPPTTPAPRPTLLEEHR